MTVANEASVVDVEELDIEGGRALFERACQERLEVGAEEFLARNRAGEYPEEWSEQAIAEVEFLLPYAR